MSSSVCCQRRCPEHCLFPAHPSIICKLQYSFRRGIAAHHPCHVEARPETEDTHLVLPDNTRSKLGRSISTPPTSPVSVYCHNPLFSGPGVREDKYSRLIFSTTEMRRGMARVEGCSVLLLFSFPLPLLLVLPLVLGPASVSAGRVWRIRGREGSSFLSEHHNGTRRKGRGRSAMMWRREEGDTP